MLKSIRTACAIVATGILGVSPAVAEDTHKFKMATSWGGGYVMELGPELFAKYVDELSDGRIEIEIFPGGTLGSALEVSDLVRNGVADMGHTWMGYDWGEDRTTVLFGGYAGSFPSDLMLHWLYQGGGADLWEEYRREEFNLVSMPLYIRTPEVFLHSRKEVSSLDDLQGLKLRTVGAWLEISKTMGAAPVTAPAAEVYTMLERGVVDAVEWGTMSENQSTGFHQVAKYVIVPGAHQPTAPFELIISTRTWEKLSEEDQKLIRHAARLATLDSWLTLGQRDAEAKNFYLDAGNTVIELEDEVQRNIFAAGRAWADEQSKGNVWFKRVLDHQAAFQETWQGSEAYRNIAQN